MDDAIFYTTTQSELLPVDHEYSWSTGCRRHRRVWAGAGLQRVAYRGGGILLGFLHSLFLSAVSHCANICGARLQK